MAETHRLLPGPVVDITQTAEAEELARTIHRCYIRTFHSVVA